MSRFVRPEMEVVRFNEADVIVASGGIPVVKQIDLHEFLDGSGTSVDIHFHGDSSYFADTNALVFFTKDGSGNEMSETLGNLKSYDYHHDHIGSCDAAYEVYKYFNGEYKSQDNGETWYNQAYWNFQ